MTLHLSGLICIYVLLAGYVHCDCPNGWTQDQNSCYWVSHDTENWIGALKVCHLYKAYLAEINDARENAFVYNMTQSGNVWLGGTDLDIEGEWIWFHAKADISYLHWRPNEPSNSGQDENCLEMEQNSGMWNDNRCHIFQRFVCKRAYSNGGVIIG